MTSISSDDKHKNIEKQSPYKLPSLLTEIKEFLETKTIILCDDESDGRTGSSIDERIIIDMLVDEFSELKIKVAEIRWWYDILIKDVDFGWIPVNIKTTTCKTADNVGNLSLCVHSYTNHALDFTKRYNNGQLSGILMNCFEKREFNTDYKKDYYFLVINKNDTSEIIVNSVLGLSKIKKNIHNLPFQIRWNDNKSYIFDGNIGTKVGIFMDLYKDQRSGWKETFILRIKSLRL